MSLKYPQGTKTGSLSGTILPIRLETTNAALLTSSFTGYSTKGTSVSDSEKSLPAIGSE